ncbi:hypothetical protein, partial [Thiolapillus sp.]|uniref:hypothetical protein n=1 Tax=Thiolapillus sp. TaxID=2017437 RepID=UPI0025E20A4D
QRVSSAASRLLGSTSLRFALHGWQRLLAFSNYHELFGGRFHIAPVTPYWPHQAVVATYRRVTAFRFWR